MVRRSVALLSSCALAVLLGSDPVGALASGSKEHLCEAKKMEASSRYYDCLTNAMRKTLLKGGAPSDEEIARCDSQFDRAFERAGEHADCHTPGGALPVRDAIKELVQATYATVVAATGPCAVLYVDPGRAICGLSQSQSSVDLTQVLEQVNSDPAVTTTVNTGTTIWIEAWGAPGGNGSAGGGTADEGQGYPGGYAQMTTTVADIQANYGVTELYYYLGKKGGPVSCVSGAKVCGGNGGTSTFVMSKDATANKLTEASLLLLAGAGGGGGASNDDKAFNCDSSQGEAGLHGGAGAIAISGLGGETRVSGQNGDQKSSGYSGQGGGSGGNGGTGPTDYVGNGSAQAGDNEFAPIGGIGGRNTSNPVGFINVPAILDKGHGGAGGTPDSVEPDVPGGAGGGGLAGGGGGTEGYDESNCSSGGGGGGSSLAKASTRSCKIAPTMKPPNPNGSTGYVQIVVDLGGC